MIRIDPDTIAATPRTIGSTWHRASHTGGRQIDQRVRSVELIAACAIARGIAIAALAAMRALVVREEPTPDEVDTLVVDEHEFFARDRVTRLDDPDELGIHDRPTLPVPAPPFESGVRLGATVISVTGASVDIVTADLTRDPRSEDFIEAAPDEPPRRPISYMRVIVRS